MRKAGATSVASSRKIIQTGKGGISGTEGSYKASQRWPYNATMNVDIFELWLVGRVEKKVAISPIPLEVTSPGVGIKKHF